MSTAVKGMEHEKARSVGFQRLFQYISGENKAGIPGDMPTLTQSLFFYCRSMSLDDIVQLNGLVIL